MRTPAWNAGILVSIPGKPLVPLPPLSRSAEDLIKHSQHMYGRNLEEGIDHHAYTPEESFSTQISDRPVPEEAPATPATSSAGSCPHVEHDTTETATPDPAPAPTPARRPARKPVTRRPSRKQQLLADEGTVELHELIRCFDL